MARLGDICTFQSGGTPSRSNAEFFNGSIPWITTVALSGGEIDGNDAVEWITEKAISNSAAKIVPANSVMVGTRVGVGKVAINSVPMSTSQDVISLVGIDETKWDKHYICEFLSSKKEYLNSQARGATIKGIRIEVLANLVLPDITLVEQVQVADNMHRISELIYKQHQQLEKLDDLIKARFVESFGDPIQNSQNRPTTDFIKVVTLQRGFDLPVQDRKQSGIIPVFGSNGALDHHNIAKVHGGGVITGRSGTIGKVFYTEGDYWPLNTTLFSVDTHGNNIIYLAYLLTMCDLSRYTEGTGVPTLNRNKFHKRPIIEIPIEEQKAFADFVKQIDKSKIVVQKALDEAQTLFDSLMQKYFGI